ncbi:hypothetical protein WMF30_50610 [Sorangium sp. So ce134]
MTNFTVSNVGAIPPPLPLELLASPPVLALVEPAPPDPTALEVDPLALVLPASEPPAPPLPVSSESSAQPGSGDRMATIAAAMKLESRSFMVHDEDGERQSLALVPVGSKQKASSFGLQRRRAIDEWDRCSRTFLTTSPAGESCATRGASSWTGKMSKCGPKIKRFVAAILVYSHAVHVD